MRSFYKSKVLNFVYILFSFYISFVFNFYIIAFVSLFGWVLNSVFALCHTCCILGKKKFEVLVFLSTPHPNYPFPFGFNVPLQHTTKWYRPPVSSSSLIFVERKHQISGSRKGLWTTLGEEDHWERPFLCFAKFFFLKLQCLIGEFSIHSISSFFF